MNRSAHFDAFLALADAGTPVPLHDSGAPLDDDGVPIRASYAIAFDIGLDELDDRRFLAPQRPASAAIYRWRIRAVGIDRHAADSVLDAVGSAVIGEVLIVEGRECEPIEIDVDSIKPTKRDTAISPPLFFVEADFTTRSKES